MWEEENNFLNWCLKSVSLQSRTNQRALWMEND
jgi:hypothetical protein